MGTWEYKPVLKQLQSNSGDKVDPANVSCVAATITRLTLQHSSSQIQIPPV